MESKPQEQPVVVLSGENQTVHSTIFLVEQLLHNLDGNAPIFSATKEKLVEYLEERITQERTQPRSRAWKAQRIRVLKAVRSYFPKDKGQMRTSRTCPV